jgi:FkbM family methyltransferase
MSKLARKIADKATGLKRLVVWMRHISNWREVWKYQRDKNRLPPIHLRNGVTLHHGPFDSPLLMVDEVFVREWYRIAGMPPENATMLDVGANIGAVTLYWAQRSPSLRVHCYEPNPAAFETLQRNVELNKVNGRATLFPVGVGRSRGTLQLWVDIPTDFSTAYSDAAPEEGARRLEVPVVGIDDAWDRIGRRAVWLLKVDTEGAEADILEGASADFLGAVQNVIIEYHDNLVPGAFARCQRILDQAGFRCSVIRHPWDEGIIYGFRSAATN